MKIDLNCDLGEGYGYHDEAVMPFITSANIACGFHAGDSLMMLNTAGLAVQHNVAVGAHPGYPDLEGFGRRPMEMTPEAIEAMVLYQVSAMAGMARAVGTELMHVKPHGAFYNRAAADSQVANAIAHGVVRFSKDLILVGLAGSALVAAGVVAGLRVANEAFPDRAYNADGTLVDRNQPGALLSDPEVVVANAVRLAAEGITVGDMHVQVDTLCIHGDNPAAPALAKAVWSELAAAGVTVMSLAKVL